MGINQRDIVRMTEAEVDTYVSVRRPAAMATLSSDGLIHQVAMYFAWFDGAIHVVSKAKAQKVVNLRRDPRCSFHVESGEHYAELAGVNLAGHAEILEDEASLWEIGSRLAAHQHREVDGSSDDFIKNMLRSRVAVRLRPTRVVSWDHAKLPPGSYPAG